MTSAVALRPLSTHEDFAACVELQRQTWGGGFSGCVPASLLKVSQLVGGVSGGAFLPDGRMVGFVFGLTGVRGSRLVHWSHMLAVLPEYRDQGVGRRLKEYQRDVLRGMGVEVIYWTFDPLVARNAHLNLNRLGTEVEDYIPDMYGQTGSELHAFGTDRLVVSWLVAPPAGPRPELPASWRTAPLATAAPRGRAQPWPDGAGGEAEVDGPVVRIEIPTHVEQLPVRDARWWRESTRPVFLRLLRAGYRVVGFVSEREAGFYVIARADAGSAR